MAICLKFISNCPASAGRASGKRFSSFVVGLVLNDFKMREWEKIGILSLESLSQIFKGTRRIQDPAQFCRQTNTKRQFIRTRI